jgi:hypothetical protein
MKKKKVKKVKKPKILGAKQTSFLAPYPSALHVGASHKIQEK